MLKQIALPYTKLTYNEELRRIQMVNTREAPGKPAAGKHPTDPLGGTEKGPGASGRATGVGPTDPSNDYNVNISRGNGAPVTGGKPEKGPKGGGNGLKGPRMGNF